MYQQHSQAARIKKSQEVEAHQEEAPEEGAEEEAVDTTATQNQRIAVTMLW